MLSLRTSPIPIRQIEAIVLTYRRNVLSDTPLEEHLALRRLREGAYDGVSSENKLLTEKQIQKILDFCESNLSEAVAQRETTEGDETIAEVLRREAYQNAMKWRSAVKNVDSYKEKCLDGNMDACKLCKDLMTHEEAWHFKLEKNIILAEERGDLQRLAELRTRVYPDLPL